MKVVGIDPGITGALALVDQGEVMSVHDMPIMTGTNKKNQVNPYELASVLMQLTPDKVVIERVSAMPGQGVSSTFSFGKSAGILEGVCGGLGIPVAFITPQKWKKKFSLIGQDKDHSRTLAIQQHPMLAGDLKRKKDIGRADAIFIAKAGAEE